MAIVATINLTQRKTRDKIFFMRKRAEMHLGRPELLSRHNLLDLFPDASPGDPDLDRMQRARARALTPEARRQRRREILQFLRSFRHGAR